MSWSQLRLPVSMIYELFIQSRHYGGIAHLFALAFPHLSTLCNCSSVQASKSTDLTRLMCVPMPRCMPEQLRPIVSGRAVREAQVQKHTGCRQICPSSSLPILDLFRHAMVSDRTSKGSRSFRAIARTLVPLAIRAALVSFKLQQALDCLLVLGGAVRCRIRSSSGHDGLSTSCKSRGRWAIWRWRGCQ